MSTRNIGFYEDLTKNYLSITIKYAFYLFFCIGNLKLLACLWDCAGWFVSEDWSGSYKTFFRSHLN